MGIDVQRFRRSVPRDFVCPICTGVVERPVQVGPCEHMFCRECLEGWLQHHQSCPVDRTAISTNDVFPASRLSRNLLSEMEVECGNKSRGCLAVCTLSDLESHETNCRYAADGDTSDTTGSWDVSSAVLQKQQECIKSIELLKTSLDTRLPLVVTKEDFERGMSQLERKVKAQIQELRELVVSIPRVSTPSLDVPYGCLDAEAWGRRLERSTQRQTLSSVRQLSQIVINESLKRQAVQTLLKRECPVGFAFKLVHSASVHPVFRHLTNEQLEETVLRVVDSADEEGRGCVMLVTLHNENPLNEDDMLVLRTDNICCIQ